MPAAPADNNGFPNPLNDPNYGNPNVDPNSWMNGGSPAMGAPAMGGNGANANMNSPAMGAPAMGGNGANANMNSAPANNNGFPNPLNDPNYGNPNRRRLLK